MSPAAENMLLHQIVPRIASAIPLVVSHVGCEDKEELLQDGTAMAARILINAKRNGKKVTAGNVAYYTLQHLKSGRRTVGNSVAELHTLATAQLALGQDREALTTLEEAIRVAVAQKDRDSLEDLMRDRKHFLGHETSTQH